MAQSPAPHAPPAPLPEAQAAATHPTGTGAGGSQTEFSTRPYPVAADPNKSKEEALAAVQARLEALKARLAATDKQRQEAAQPPVLGPLDVEALSGRPSAEKLEALRVRLATRLDEDALASLNAAVTELSALEGHVAVTTPNVPPTETSPPPKSAA